MCDRADVTAGKRQVADRKALKNQLGRAISRSLAIEPATLAPGLPLAARRRQSRQLFHDAGSWRKSIAPERARFLSISGCYSTINNALSTMRESGVKVLQRRLYSCTYGWPRPIGRCRRRRLWRCDASKSVHCRGGELGRRAHDFMMKFNERKIPTFPFGSAKVAPDT